MSSTLSEDEFDDASTDYINEEAAQVRKNWVSIETVNDMIKLFRTVPI